MAEQELTPAERSRGQRCGIIGNSMSRSAMMIVRGGVMMLYAHDVLAYSPKRIAALLALTPLIGVLRFPLLPFYRRVGLVRTLIIGSSIRVGATAALLLIPARYLSFWLYALLLLLFMLGSQAVIVPAWQPIIRNLTTKSDRGSFFGNMRAVGTVVMALTAAALALFVGGQITELQYKVLLAFALLGYCNQFFWLSRIPLAAGIGVEEPGGAGAEFGRIWRTVREARVLRRPLFIALLVNLGTLPIMMVYLRTVIKAPSNLLALQIVVATLGIVVAQVVFGRLADAIGYRPVTIGLLWIGIAVAPLYLLLGPLGPEVADWRFDSLSALVSAGVLLLVALVKGMLTAGLGISTTSILHFHVGREESLEAMNLYHCAVTLFAAGVAFASGWYLQDVVIPWGQFTLLNGILHFDLFKAYLIFFVPLLYLVVIWQASRLPNARPYFGLGDFFGSIFASPIRTIVASRHLHHEDNERREELARWLGANVSPMGIDSMLELLGDPSYDVKVEAIRALARTKSLVAGKELLAMLRAPEHEHLSDHVAWALGELGYLPAGEQLLERLGPSNPPRVRAMAARALGKLGQASALPPLVELMQREDDLLVCASACRALLCLEGGRAHADLVFDNLGKLSNRDERYELMDVLCDWLGIPNRWLLRSSASVSAWESLRDEIDRRSGAWHAAREDAIRAFMERDLEQLKHLFDGAMLDGEIVQALARALGRSDRWGPVAVLASARLLRAE